MMKRPLHFSVSCSCAQSSETGCQEVALGSVTEVLHEVLHGVLSDETGGAESVFLGGSGDRVGAKDVRPPGVN